MLATKYNKYLLPALLLICAPMLWANPVTAINTLLDNLHDAAKRGDASSYYATFSDRAIVFGTDASERWTMPEFRAYTDKVFEVSGGWEFNVITRNVEASMQQSAWFDEILSSQDMGELRTTGVIVFENGQWKIARYHLAIPVPNPVAADVIKTIRTYKTSESP